MSKQVYLALVALLGTGFALIFFVVVAPPLLASGDIIGAFAAGFVNPYASGYSFDVFFCYGVLAVWVVYERATRGVRYGWTALLIGIAPGVATGFALYLWLRERDPAGV